MQSYSYRGIVSKAETEALKELIFNRVRQRAEAMARNAQEQYTTSFKEEIMDIARSSFNSPGNPFAQRTEQTATNRQDSNRISSGKEEVKLKDKKPVDIGFKQKTSEDNIKEIIKYRNERTKEEVSQKEVYGIMGRANSEFETSKNFIGALEFLNSQAGIYMASQKKAKFDAIA